MTLTLNGLEPSSGAPLASPAFTGNPTAPTASAGDSDTSIATTAFVQAAVSAVGAVGSGSATWATNTQTVWSYTLAEGEFLGGRFMICTGHSSGGTLSVSVGSGEFIARRPVGGSAVVTTNGSPVENGTSSLALGTMGISASGNDVIVTLLFPSLTGTAYYQWVFTRLVPPVA